MSLVTVPRFRIVPSATISPIFILTMSQPRSLLSTAKSNDARSRKRRCSSRKSRIALALRGLSGLFAPTMLPAFHGRRSHARGSRPALACETTKQLLQLLQTCSHSVIWLLQTRVKGRGPRFGHGEHATEPKRIVLLEGVKVEQFQPNHSSFWSHTLSLD
jgi:hypothetical protein